MSEPLDPDTATLLAEIDQQPAPPIAQSTPEQLRAGFSDLLRRLHPHTPAPFAGTTRDDTVRNGPAEIPVRVYQPTDADGDDVVVYIHGGGWVLGGLDSADPAAAELAMTMGVRVISVGYRLAPEHPYPAAYDDALAVTRSVAATNPRWLGVAGDSAGGNLAAAIGRTAPDEHVRVDAQLLFYPALDPTMRAASHTDFADGFLLTREAMAFYWAAYKGDAESTSESFTPYDAASLIGSPPTVITTAGYDPLRDEGEQFAARLLDSGIQTIHIPSPTLIHGWVDQMDRVPAAAEAFRQGASAFNELRIQHRSQTGTSP
ncbi:alpha/beta hydrolase [Herbiconiux sp. CPCC 203407]|uniref:Alpha/beta hydrolase n=1 Tax=Herbiconiux oxytropis TaxID=2970915 RepID=A0AA42BSV5_9MICO|nr:alpha/beta hydrolase [Herbiconiux oxytropis]MCS5721489.1 alpha/beta hydrolase [Herbiconiux oxytropis]MCS5724566.1 alpha/beta hydrolase [Herbiconiux oxytropis]